MHEIYLLMLLFYTHSINAFLVSEPESDIYAPSSMENVREMCGGPEKREI